MATEDINKIKSELKECVEIELPYDFKTTDMIKYITLNGKSEKFYIGGKFTKYGNERIILNNGGREWSFKTKIRDNNNNIIYTSRIFLVKNKELPFGKPDELRDIVISQQKVIDKMSLIIKKYQHENEKYKLAITKLKHIK
jgi:hypothetical protein